MFFKHDKLLNIGYNSVDVYTQIYVYTLCVVVFTNIYAYLNLTLARIRWMVLKNFDGYYVACPFFPTFYNLQKSIVNLYIIHSHRRRMNNI